ncbi:MAG: prepilin-type N-terminal cleavage/methylation domain-containing protein [Phycisphaerales bacterium]|nr:prepilin-type N-terminal cleavage/methylation domain-containing protein [Phycisphaerales bacterium]
MSSTNPLHRSPSRPRLARRAFSLIEVIVAVTIVAIMAAVFVPRLTKFIGSAKDKRAKTEAASLAQQVKLYMTEAGMSRCPEDFDLDVLTDGDDPYLENKQALLDPWGNAYVIIIPGQVNFEFDLMSYGADGQPGGEGDNKDIVNGEK